MKNKKIAIIVIVVIAVILIAGAVFLVKSRSDKNTTANSTGQRSTINYDPPTEEEQAAGDEQKQQNAEEQARIDQQPTTGRKAEVVVSDATYYPYDGDNIEVRGYISNVLEDGGTCTATFTNASGQKVVKTNPGFKDASTTQCGALDVPRSQFPAGGDWQLVLSYQSSTASGQSAARAVSLEK